MEPITLTVQRNHFAGVAAFRAKTDVRKYLEGMLITTSATGAYLVATDGHMLAVHKIDAEPRLDLEIIIPAATIDTALKIKGKHITTLTIDLGDVEGKYDANKPARKGQIRTVDGTLLFEEMPWTLRGWRRVCKFTPTTEQVVYDPRLLARVDDAAQLIRGKTKYPTIVRPGANGGCGFAQLDLDGKTCAWVMPMRDSFDALPSHPGFTF